mmetsp:Transcript_18304/g.35960  ORF Transcript_18304/g.35960 Transcript_18304/m.35960 type:complete len:231 (-) Transcript_18304:1307-1999(-)
MKAGTRREKNRLGIIHIGIFDAGREIFLDLIVGLLYKFVNILFVNLEGKLPTQLLDGLANVAFGTISIIKAHNTISQVCNSCAAATGNHVAIIDYGCHIVLATLRELPAEKCWAPKVDHLYIFKASFFHFNCRDCRNTGSERVTNDFEINFTLGGIVDVVDEILVALTQPSGGADKTGMGIAALVFLRIKHRVCEHVGNSFRATYNNENFCGFKKTLALLDCNVVSRLSR